MKGSVIKERNVLQLNPNKILLWLVEGPKNFKSRRRRRKGKTSKFVDAGGYNKNERGIADLEWVDREGWRRKINLL